MLDLLITGGTLVDGQGTHRGSLAIAGGRIIARHAAGAALPPAHRTIDATGRLVLPGIVDPHVHFYGEGIAEYSRLAVRGGVTTFIGMIRGAPERPDDLPPPDATATPAEEPKNAVEAKKAAYSSEIDQLNAM